MDNMNINFISLVSKCYNKDTNGSINCMPVHAEYDGGMMVAANYGNGYDSDLTPIRVKRYDTGETLIIGKIFNKIAILNIDENDINDLDFCIHWQYPDVFYIMEDVVIKKICVYDEIAYLKADLLGIEIDPIAVGYCVEYTDEYGTLFIKEDDLYDPIKGVYIHDFTGLTKVYTELEYNDIYD